MDKSHGIREQEEPRCAHVGTRMHTSEAVWSGGQELSLFRLRECHPGRDTSKLTLLQFPPLEKWARLQNTLMSDYYLSVHFLGYK
jgi:hypothetical protein